MRTHSKIVLQLCCSLLVMEMRARAMATVPSADAVAERITERKIAALHHVDTLNMTLYTMLMILTVLTVWFFKYRRLRFVHETGLTLLYGLIVGFTIKMVTKGSSKAPMTATVTLLNSTVDLEEPPDYVRLGVPYFDTQVGANSSIQLRYKFDTNDNEYREALLEEKATFDSEIFFNILLPPIIFHAGYSLKKRHFFRNIGSILVFAVFGTSISCAIVGLIVYGVSVMVGMPFSLSETFLFGAVISATDPVTILAVFNDINVDANLFALVFGESALNDAVAIVLSQTIEQYSPSPGNATSAMDGQALVNSCGQFFGVFFGSMAVGSLIGCLASLFMKFTRISQFPLLETTLFVLMSYLSFLVSEAAHLTGIVSVLFCGICQAHYTFNNLSVESKLRTRQFFDVLNFMSENFIYTYIGVSMFTSQSHLFNPWFILSSFVAIFVGRAVNIYLLSALLNIGRSPPIPLNYQHLMVFAGLRGAMAFALAIRNTSTPQMRAIYTTTSLIVICSVLVNGGLSSCMIEFLKIKCNANGAADDSDAINEDERASRHSGANLWDKSFLPRKWYEFDQKFLKPVLTNSAPTLLDTMPKWCRPLAKMLTTSTQINRAEYNRLQDGRVAANDAFEHATIFPPDANVLI